MAVSIAIVPVPVIGPPVKPVPVATLVTVPVPLLVSHVIAPLPSVCNTWLADPSAAGNVKASLNVTSPVLKSPVIKLFVSLFAIYNLFDILVCPLPA